jgi:hypothetical protein
LEVTTTPKLTKREDIIRISFMLFLGQQQNSTFNSSICTLGIPYSVHFLKKKQQYKRAIKQLLKNNNNYISNFLV